MSPLTRFMHTARAVLDEQDRERLAPDPHQPPVFVHTNWLFVEIDEALIECARLSTAIKVARLETNVAEVARLNGEMQKKLSQAVMLSGDVTKHFGQEGV